MDYRDRAAGLGPDYFASRAQLFLLEKLVARCRLPERPEVLSIGCGDGVELQVLNRHGPVDVLEPDRKALELIPPDWYRQAFPADLSAFRTDRRYDLIVALDVLEHIEDDRGAADRIRELMKDTGCFIFTVPAHQGLFSAHDRALGHVRRYSRKDLKLLFSGRLELALLTYRYMLLFLPAALTKLVNRNRPARNEAPRLPAALNALLVQVMKAETTLIGWGLPLPFGLSFAGICRKS